MRDVTFVPSGPQVECVNVSIVRDFLVEEDEMFSFAVSPNQFDGAVQVGTPNTSSITILDEDDGNHTLHKPNPDILVLFSLLRN